MNSAEGSAERLAETLAKWPTWRDVSPYEGGPVPFYKRAQIAAADLHLSGIAPAEDIDRLTLFADNLVPHVLRLDGVLEFDERLVGRIDAGFLLEHDSPEEVEIRACALTAVELLVEARPDLNAAVVDNILWNRGSAAALQGAAPPPRPHDRVLVRPRGSSAPGGRCRPGSRSRRRCWSPTRSRSGS